MCSFLYIFLFTHSLRHLSSLQLQTCHPTYPTPIYFYNRLYAFLKPSKCTFLLIYLLEDLLSFITSTFSIRRFISSHLLFEILNLLCSSFIFVVLKIPLAFSYYSIVLYLYFIEISCPRCSSRHSTLSFFQVITFLYFSLFIYYDTSTLHKILFYI